MSKTKEKMNFGPVEYDKGRDMRARDLLIQARVAMLIKHDFWGKMATRMRLINADEWCGTLATDGKNFYYNSQFVLGLGNIEKVIFGFAHEVLHCIYDHIPRTGDRDKKLSNIAQDYVINADLVHFNVGQKIDEVEREHIPERKLEIELPGAGSRWQVPFGVAKSQTELNNLEQINIAFQGLIVIVVH